MRYFDRSFFTAVALFFLGSILGAFLMLGLPSIRGVIIGLLEARLLTPVRTVSQFGNAALLLLVFLNNSIPPLLSFAYSFLIIKVSWTPPLTLQKRRVLLSCFTWLCAFLVGLFGFGMTLSVGWLLGGRELLFNLVRSAWVHGPIELGAILLCVSEPLRLAEQRDQTDLRASLRLDFRLLSVCLLMLVLSAAIEVLVGV
jgi:hypothetical protein